MMQPDKLKEKNLEALKTNNYSTDECIDFANEQFDGLVIALQPSSRGYKIALKKLADEVLLLRHKLKDIQSCKTKQEKQSSLGSSSQVPPHLVSV